MLDVKKRVNSLVSLQRMAALPIASAYSTVSAPVALVIAGTIPVDLLATERMEIYKAKSAGNHLATSGKTPFQNGNDWNGIMKIEEVYGKTYSGPKAADYLEIWSGKLLRYTDTIWSWIF